MYGHKPALLFITNLEHEDRSEDLYLAGELSEKFSVTLVNPREAAMIVSNFSYCIIRNAWPSRYFKSEFEEIRKYTELGKLKIYNPLHQIPRGFLEDKTYLVELYQKGHSVIPSWFDKRTMMDAGYQIDTPVLLKPLDGCSSYGIIKTTLGEVTSTKNYILQPELVFKNELSFFFIDKELVYTLESQGPNNRWDLTECIPSKQDQEWAEAFVKWNHSLSYGIQRIDGMRLFDGSLLLVEIEDSTPMLSLLEISEKTRKFVVSKLIDSVENAFKTQ